MFFNVYQVFIFHLKCTIASFNLGHFTLRKERQRFWCWPVRAAMLLVPYNINQVKQFSKNKFRWNISAQNSFEEIVFVPF